MVVEHPTERRIAIIGGGWAGLSAAIAAVEAGHEVHLFEMARDAGGRARSHLTALGLLDNGQHILIGAYRECLRLMQLVGVDADHALLRAPLSLTYPDGSGLILPNGSPSTAFARGVWTNRQWSWTDRLALLGEAMRWRLSGFAGAPDQTVASLCRRLPASIVSDLIEPLCVAALNTSMASASAQVFLRVLKDALFGGPGSADLILPRLGLSALFADPAIRWLQGHGTTVHLGHRVAEVKRIGGVGWRLADRNFDGVVMATSAREAARLTEHINPVWSATTKAMDHQPIVTVWLAEPTLSLHRPMVALHSGDDRPAQFCFDLAKLGGPARLFTFVISDAGHWVDLGMDVTIQALLRQVRRAFAGKFADDGCVRHLHTERRATFHCRTGLHRPPADIAPGLVAAADYVDGPYPATLEGAARSGQRAMDLLKSVAQGQLTFRD